MLAAAAVNLHQFAEIDAGLGPTLKALHEFDSFDVIELGMMSAANIHGTLNLYAVVGREAPGTPLIVTSPELNRRNSEFRARMIGIGLVSRIESCEVDTAGIALDPTIELQRGVVWKSPRQARLRKAPGTTWAFATASATPSRLIQLKTPEVDVLIVDEDLLEGKVNLCL
jgi:hypothetical protein